MPDQNLEFNVKPVKWVDIEADLAVELADELLYGDNEFGDNWTWAYEFDGGDQVKSIFCEFKEIDSLHGRHAYAVRQIAAMVIVSCPTGFREDSFETAIERAIDYLSAPTPWFGQEERLHSVLAYSAHALLDIEGFLEMQRSFAIKVEQMPELQWISA